MPSPVAGAKAPSAKSPHQPPATRRARYGVIVIAGLVGAAAAFAMFSVIGQWQARVTELRFASLARDHLETLNSGLKDASTDLLHALRAYFESQRHPPSRAEFQMFSHSLRQQAAGVRDTGWAPRVPAAERDAFERSIRDSGFPDFQIVERNADGTLVRAPARAEYFPILYSDPGDINRPILGFDLASEPLRGRVIAQARATDAPAATPPLRLMNMQRPNGGMMSFIPVDRVPVDRAPADRIPVDRGNALAGIVLAAFETDTMIANILATRVRLTGLDLYVFDRAAPDANRLIYWHSAHGLPPPSEIALRATRHWEGTLELIDQRWGVIFAASDEAVVDAGWTALAVLVGGLLLTASMVFYLWRSLRRTIQLEELTANLHDTTESLRRNGAKLDHMARHDALTGLANRVAFRDEVAAGLRRVSRGQELAVLYLDLDRFKAVNDTLGHPAGDRLLCGVAARLREAVREVDTITRLGGDEFAIAQFGVDQPRSAETLARRLIDALSRPYMIDGSQVAVGVSIGITLAGRDDLDVDQLLRRADMALYAAKREGRGTWRCFERAMDDDAQARRGLEMDLRDAIAHDRFELHYQPQLAVAGGRVRGFEALLRWHHSDRGLVLPGDFIRCAEETGLIAPIGAWVLHTALRHAASWPDDVRVAVNVSPLQLARGDLVETVESALAAANLPGTRLELEITENALIQQDAATLATLKRLRALGVQIAMDDFGTGYASLSHLRSFPFDRIKIDQSFIGDMTETASSLAIVRAILQLASSLGIATTAEGVETPEQFVHLAAAGCQEVQGFLFARPQPPSEVPRMLAHTPRQLMPAHS